MASNTSRANKVHTIYKKRKTLGTPGVHGQNFDIVYKDYTDMKRVIREEN